ncbi:hypothetical protein ON010_g13644 [Phytophthora cinnamomi]|nr:hypothetical protein ON010_g13644 [Phytophthora cinnamomi]
MSNYCESARGSSGHLVHLAFGCRLTWQDADGLKNEVCDDVQPHDRGLAGPAGREEAAVHDCNGPARTRCSSWWCATPLYMYAGGRERRLLHRQRLRVQVVRGSVASKIRDGHANLGGDLVRGRADTHPRAFIHGRECPEGSLAVTLAASSPAKVPNAEFLARKSEPATEHHPDNFGWRVRSRSTDVVADDSNQVSVTGFTVFSVVLKLALQEAARYNVLERRIRSIRYHVHSRRCAESALPTVLNATQSPIVLLVTQKNSFLMVRTFGMALAEIAPRATKAATRHGIHSWSAIFEWWNLHPSFIILDPHPSPPMSSQAPILASLRVAPLPDSPLTIVSLAQTSRSAAATDPTISDLMKRPADNPLRSQLRLRLQWEAAYKIQVSVFRNSLACLAAVISVNGCFYAGNIFSSKPSVEQSPQEFMMAILVWTTLSFDVVLVVAHLPSLKSQRFLHHPDYKPSVTLAARKIYYTETYQGRDRRLSLKIGSKPRTASRLPPRAPYPAPHYHAPTFWREYLVNLPYAALIALAGGYVHIVCSYNILNQGTIVIVLFTMIGVAIKLALQEIARLYVLKQGVRSIRTMCVLVGVPTVLIDTQARIALLGTQSNSFLVSGTAAMAIAELCLRAAKGAFVARTIHRRAKSLEVNLQQTSANDVDTWGPQLSILPRNLEFELWRRQVLSYHTAEITADTYAEYIAIGCSQSIIFWFVGHPLYPALQLSTGNEMGGGATSELNIARWRINQVAMLTFQFVVEIFVDYVCVVVEMAAGIDFDHIKDLGTFLGVLFMAMAVINISISSAIYLHVPKWIIVRQKI